MQNLWSKKWYKKHNTSLKVEPQNEPTTVNKNVPKSITNWGTNKWLCGCRGAACTPRMPNNTYKSRTFSAIYIHRYKKWKEIILYWGDILRRELFFDSQTRLGRLRAWSGLEKPCGMTPPHPQFRGSAFCDSSCQVALGGLCLWQILSKPCFAAVSLRKTLVGICL